METSQEPCGPPKLILNHHNPQLFVSLVKQYDVIESASLSLVKNAYAMIMKMVSGKQNHRCSTLLYEHDLVFVAPPCSK